MALPMTRIARKSDGRRIFTDAFKREQIDHVLRGKVTLAELSRRLGIARSLLQRWKRTLPAATPAVGSHARLQPAVNKLDTAHYIRELQQLVGKQALELEILRAELGTLKAERHAPGVAQR